MMDVAPSLRKLFPGLAPGDHPIMAPIGWYPALVGFADRVDNAVRRAGGNHFAFISSTAGSSNCGLSLQIDSSLDLLDLCNELIETTRVTCRFCRIESPEVPSGPRCDVLKVADSRGNLPRIDVCPMYRGDR